MNDDLSPYTVLGVMPSASPAEITRAFRAKLRALHPDTRHPDPTTATTGDTQLRQVLAAYQVLRDAGRRADYDRRAGRTRVPGSAAPAAAAQNTQGPVHIPVTYYRRGN